MHLTIDESKRPTEQASEMKQVSAKKSLWLHPPVHHLTAIGLAGEPVAPLIGTAAKIKANS